MREGEVADLIDLLDQAANLPTVERTTEHIKDGLCRLIRSGAVVLSEDYRRVVADRYARRLLHRNDQLGYSIIVMTWAPGQCTPVHDHDGMWCVEGVLEGHIEVQQYELVAREDDDYCFEKRNSYHAGVASAGCLIPPFEYHRIANTDPQDRAVSIHVYGGDMTRCNVFEHLEDSWYRRHERPLELD